ncbi:hypothetical protein K3495_g10427 [Podosphaera aphanis]|nr:hypothetical protein K3495_g10427 [Podosphaera aphanis]
MERVPVAQAINGQPFVDPNASSEVFTMNAVKPVDAAEATLWTTQTVTTTDISIIMSTSVTVSTSVAITTSYVNAVETSIVMETQTATASPQTNSTLTTSYSSSATGEKISQTTDSLSSISTVLPSLAPNNGSTTLGIAMSSAMSLPTPASSLGDIPQSPMIPVHSSDALPKLMGGMLGGIFLLAGVLAGGLFIFRRRKQRVSEQEEAANAQRQEQPLMTLPIVPYSSAYGSDLHK